MEYQPQVQLPMVRKMLDSTLIMVSTEFGRTPKVNKDEGRDHWPKVFSVR